MENAEQSTQSTGDLSVLDKLKNIFLGRAIDFTLGGVKGVQILKGDEEAIKSVQDSFNETIDNYNPFSIASNLMQRGLIMVLAIVILALGFIFIIYGRDKGIT